MPLISRPIRRSVNTYVLWANLLTRGRKMAILSCGTAFYALVRYDAAASTRR